jgi:protein ImuB
MLWMCLSLPHLPASALGVVDGAVADQRGSQRWLITSAGDLGAGTSLACALAVRPELVVHARQPQAEHDALTRLAHWIYHYGSPVTCEVVDLQEAGRRPRARLWFEAGASLKLFGGLKALRGRLLGELEELGHTAQCAVAPTRAGCALLAESGREKACRDLPALHAALASLPIASLPWPGDELQALRDVGLRKLGELFALPRESFARRFGEARLNELDRLRGLAREPFEAVTPPPRYARRFELSGDIESVEPLLFPLRRICAELAAYLRARDSGALALVLHLAHGWGAPSRIEFRFLAPTRDPARIFAALNERLLNQPPERPVRELTIEVEEFATPQPVQGDLFDPLGGRSLDWEQALERVLARFGGKSLWTPQCIADHRPERAFARAAPGSAGEAIAEPRPLWLLKAPQPIHAPEVAEPPERIESGWWDGADATRDYYRVERDGSRAWVFQDRRSGDWFLQGWFA